jgi:hypothetical protein
MILEHYSKGEETESARARPVDEKDAKEKRALMVE